MDTQQVKTEQTATEALIQGQPAHSAFPHVVVRQMFAPISGNTKGQNVQVQWVTKKEQSVNRNLTSFFLGAMAIPAVEKRTALQFMGNDVIEKLKLDVGVSLNDVLKKAGEPAVRLSISEISHEEYLEAKEANQANVIGYSMKRNPSTDELMGYKGAPIWRRTYIDVVDGNDEYLTSDGSTVDITEDNITV